MDSISPLQHLRDVPLAFLDVETTGAVPARGHRVTEVGILTIQSGRVVDRYSQLINPRCRVPSYISQLTGITQEMVDQAPDFAEVQHEIARRLRGAVIIGHNIRFDLAFIRSEFERIAVDHGPLINLSSVIDTVRLARRAFGRRGNGLQRLAQRLGIAVESAHRALADCETTARLFERIITPHGGWNLLLADLIALQGGASKSTSPVEVPVPAELVEAIRAQHHVRMVYLDTRNNRRERIVIPIELRTVGKSRCVSAFCTLHQERRIFHLHRIVALSAVESLYDHVSVDPVPPEPESLVEVNPQEWPADDERVEP